MNELHLIFLHPHDSHAAPASKWLVQFQYGIIEKLREILEVNEPTELLIGSTKVLILTVGRKGGARKEDDRNLGIVCVCVCRSMLIQRSNVNVLN